MMHQCVRASFSDQATNEPPALTYCKVGGFVLRVASSWTAAVGDVAIRIAAVEKTHLAVAPQQALQ